MKTYKKVINETSIEVTKTTPEEIKTEVIPEKVEVVQYKLDFLKEQKVRVEKDLVDLTERHKKELTDLKDRQAKEIETAQANIDEVNEFLLESEKLGIKDII